jgi:hypothetical protein
MQFVIQNIALRSLGYKTPSPLVGISLVNSESGIQTNFKVTIHVLGDQRKQAHVGSFEMMLYEFAQMRGDSTTPCYLEMGWADETGILESLSIQGIFIQFTSTVHTGYTEYVLEGIGNFTNTATIRGIAIPAIRGNYRPSDVAEAVLDYVHAGDVFDYDIDHDDEVVPISKASCVTSLGEYINGSSTQQGLIQQSYCEGSKSCAYGLPYNRTTDMYLKAGYKKAEIRKIMGTPVAQTQRSASSYTFSITEPTFHTRGVIRYKNNVNLANYVSQDVLMWGGLYTNILSISATYQGVTQTLLGSGATVQTGMGITLKGETLTTQSNRQNSYNATLPSMYSAGNAINNLNAISTQFNTNVQITIVGSAKIFRVADAVRVVVYTGGTLNPITGVYRIIKVAHNINGTSYTTTLTVQRLDLITANNTATSIAGYTTTSRINNTQAASSKQQTLHLGQPFQHIINILKRGKL